MWFERSFSAPTAAQTQAWAAIKACRNVLIAAPTGSGKTLAAFMAAIDDLVRQGLNAGLRDETWSRDEALVEIVRGRLEGLGPVAAEALASQFGLTLPEVEVPLAALEAEGFVMRGRFTQPVA
jgi:Lhr-like helicase